MTPVGPRASRPPPAEHKNWHERGYLPHFDHANDTQMLTFRLADSLPQHLYEEVTRVAADEADRARRIDAMMDEGRGGCTLRSPAVATLVANALGHFDGARYRMLAWVIMPNHVHVLIEQIPGFRLGGIVSSWKSFTAKAINRTLGTTGPVWAPDYHDRFIRNAEHFMRAIAYIENNPVKAGLAVSPADWPFSSACRTARVPRATAR